MRLNIGIFYVLTIKLSISIDNFNGISGILIKWVEKQAVNFSRSGIK